VPDMSVLLFQTSFLLPRSRQTLQRPIARDRLHFAK
jgi:hypothetical protein